MHRDIESDSEDELPPGWIEKAAKDGDVFYVNTYSKGSQWTHPRTGKKKTIPNELPFGWSQTTDETGRAIFVDIDTGKRTYTDPRLAFAREVKASADDYRQRYDASSTAYQVLHGRDLSGKVAVITGANSGIGKETAKALVRHNCKVIFACRNIDAANEAVESILKEIKGNRNNCIVLHLDLNSLKSVKHFVSLLKNVTDCIDILILNAGVFGLPYTETEDCYETTLQVNHLSQMYLACLAAPLLRKKSRVLFVSSESHRWASFTNGFSEQSLCAPKERFSSMMAYNNSKLFNILTAKILSEMWSKKQIYVNSLHPGNMVFTNLCNSWWVYKLLFMFVRPFTKSLQEAAATSVYCASALELEGVTGVYFNNCFHCPVSSMANDDKIAINVFMLSLKMIVEKMGSEGLEEFIQFCHSKEKNNTIENT